MFVFSLGSITYKKCLQTDLDRANIMYAVHRVTVIYKREMTSAYSDVNTNRVDITESARHIWQI